MPLPVDDVTPASRQSRLLWLGAGVTALLALRAVELEWRRSVPSAPLLTPRTIDPRSATVAELMTLPGIGRRRAEAIVLHRVRHGAFRSWTELDQVDGIGPMTRAALLPYLPTLDADPGGRPSGARQSRVRQSGASARQSR